MNKKDDKKIKKLMHSLGLKYNLPDHVVKQIVESPYEFAYEQLKKLTLDGIQSEEELNKLKTNFNFKGLGKLYVSYPHIKKRENQKKLMNRINNKKNGRRDN